MQYVREPNGTVERGLREVELTPPDPAMPEPEPEPTYDDEGTDVFERFLLDGFE